MGKLIERKISDKGIFYQDLTRYLSMLKDNVCGRQLEMQRFNEEYSRSCGKNFAEYLNSRQLKLRLSKQQKNNISAFFDHIDCASSQALVEHITYHTKILADDANNVVQNEVRKCSIYPKLGMLLGAMLGILLI